MARKRPTLTDLLNDLTFQANYNKYRLLSVNAFTWEGLPDGIEERHIENTLFRDGRALFFRDPAMSFMCLPCHEMGQNVYGDPLHFRAVGFGYQREYDADEVVLIENNKLKLATDPFIMFYVNKITETERTADVNVKSCKTPVVFACDDKNVLSVKQIFQKIDGNTPVIYADKALNLDSLSVLDLKAKFMGNELMDYKRTVESELLTFLGLNNTPIDKKERLISDEAKSNNQLITSFSDLQLEARERACEAINAKFGLNISVKRRNVDNSVNNVDNLEGANV